MKNSCTLIIALIILITLNAQAQIPAGYYNSAAGLTGPALKTALHNIIKNHNNLSYSSLWTHFQNTDKKTNGKVWDMYSDNPGGPPPYTFTFSTDQCGSYNGEADCYNREHTWPQSWFNSDNTPSSDLFHVYPTDGYVNNIRSNYPYGDVDNPSWTSQNGSKLGPCVANGYNQTVFEPIDEYKGDLARSYFYLSTRYQNEDASWASSGGTNKSIILPWQVDVLLQWSHQDSVSSKEQNRNNSVYQIQNNRNPFIDNPQWIDSIWTITITGIGSENELKSSLTVYPNPAKDIFFMSNTSNKDIIAQLSIYSINGQLIEQFKELKIKKKSIITGQNNLSDFSIDCSSWEQGVYYLTIIENEKTSVLKFIKG